MQLTIPTINSFQLLLKTAGKQFMLMVTLIIGLAMSSFAQPGNDDPCNAIPLTPDVICNYQTFDNTGATATAGAPAPGCANYQGGDIWFQVVVPAASNGNLTFSTLAGGITDLGMAIYRGTCDNLQLIACDDDSGPGLMSLITNNSLTVGSTIWIRCWEYGGNTFGTFGICVKYPGPPPAYDDPCNATALPTPTTTCNYQTFTDDGATSSAGVPAPGCANYTGGDVWFTVTVPAGGSLSFDTQVGEVTDGGMAIYRGTCDNLQLIACDDNSSPNGNMPKIVATSLTPGSTIWIRFWSNGITGNTGSFGICVTIPPPPPANDEPCNAIQLSASNVCNYQTFSTQSATGTNGAPAPGCANYQGGDVWFKVTVPCDGKLILDTQTGVITDGGMAVYRGTCDNLQLIGCDDDGSANGLMPRLSLTSLTPGSTVYVRFWEYGNDNPGTFGICASIPPPPPPGGNCLGAQSFCSSQTYTYPNSTNVPSLGGGGIYGCLGSTPNPAWYYFQVQTAGNINILIQQTNTAGQIVDVDYVLWGPFPNLPASCGNLAANNIVSCSYSTAGTETATLTNGQVGDVYVLLITNFSNQAGSVTFYQNGGTGSTNCNIVCTLTAGNSGPACPGSLINLTASTVTGANYQWNGPNCFNLNTGLSTQQNPVGVQVPDEPGTYIYTVTATIPGPLGSTCFAQTSVVVAPRPNIGNDTTVYICKGSTKDLETVYDTTGLTTSWSHYPDGSSVGNPSAADTSGVYQVVVTSNTTGCTDTALVTLVVDTVRFNVASTGNATCTVPGQITVTDPTGVGSQFQYGISSIPGAFQPGNTFTVNPGTYTITVLDSLGCTSESAPLVVTFTDDLYPVTVRPDTTLCLNQSVTLTANSSVPGDSYTWSPSTGLSAPTSASTIASPTDTTLYTVYVTYGVCTDSAKVTIRIDKNLTVDAGGPLDIIAGQSEQATAIVTGSNPNLSTILWTPATGLSATNVLNPVVTPVIQDGTTTYQITVTNTNGCTATDQLTVNVIPNVGCENVRNAFSPNGDGINDMWLVYDSYSCLTNVTVAVFNRYGSRVFESKDYRNLWDGKYKGKELPDGTYYAIVEFKFRNGKSRTVRTDLTLLR
ncbi:MAG: gliding motility-associated C-terminal domain-containing protein [Bacteroidetes bacterium]|nr:gliding motility-associated C-terminal domain-containing protein [Bacteroidota bacterium]